MRTWWVVANERGASGGWHWREFLGLSNRSRRPYVWGGSHWIRSARSLVNVRAMRRGDLVVAYQAAEGIVGFAGLHAGGFMRDGAGGSNAFRLNPLRRIGLINPVRLDAIRPLPGARETFEFLSFSQGSVFTVAPGGSARLALLAAAFNPLQTEAILSCARLSRVEDLGLESG